MFMNLLPLLSRTYNLSFVLALLPGELLKNCLELIRVLPDFLSLPVRLCCMIRVSFPIPWLRTSEKRGKLPCYICFYHNSYWSVLLPSPLKKFFRWRVAIIRNVLSFIGALIIGACMALIWGYYEKLFNDL
jgi:hypothetical protein